MTDKQANRAKLKALQAILIGRGDEEVPQVIEELRAHLATLPVAEERAEKSGRDRKERGGRDREG